MVGSRRGCDGSDEAESKLGALLYRAGRSADRGRPCHPLLTQCRVCSLFFVPRLDPARRENSMATMTTATATVSDARVSKLARLPLFGSLPDTSPWRYYWVTSGCHRSIGVHVSVERCVHSVFEIYLIPVALIFTSAGFLDGSFCTPSHKTSATTACVTQPSATLFFGHIHQTNPIFSSFTSRTPSGSHPSGSTCADSLCILPKMLLRNSHYIGARRLPANGTGPCAFHTISPFLAWSSITHRRSGLSFVPQSMYDCRQSCRPQDGRTTGSMSLGTSFV